jgi:hypothetical protein
MSKDSKALKIAKGLLLLSLNDEGRPSNKGLKK